MQNDVNYVFMQFQLTKNRLSTLTYVLLSSFAQAYRENGNIV